MTRILIVVAAQYEVLLVFPWYDPFEESKCVVKSSCKVSWPAKVLFTRGIT